MLSIHDVSKECRKSVIFFTECRKPETGILNIKTLKTSNLAKMPIWNIKQQSSESEVEYKMEFQNSCPSSDTKTRLCLVSINAKCCCFYNMKKERESIFGKRWYSHSSCYLGHTIIIFPVFIQYKTMPSTTKRFIRRGVWSWVDFEEKRYKRAH
jgi:hypothetical protein